MNYPPDPSAQMTAIIQNPMAKNMEHEMKAGVIKGVELWIQVYKEYLHWALHSVNITYIGLFGSLGQVLGQFYLPIHTTLTPKPSKSKALEP